MKNTSSASRFLIAAGLLTPTTFKPGRRNWLDHNNIGESNLFWPITWDAALIQGWELTLRSPRLWHRGQFHLAYANQIAQATSPITGGLICPSPVRRLPTRYTAGIFTGRPRSEKHVELRFQCNSSLADATLRPMCTTARGSRTGITDSKRAISRALSARHTTFDLSLGKTFARNTRFRNRAECGQPPRGAGQQSDVWRISLERSAANLRGVSLPVSILASLRDRANLYPHQRVSSNLKSKHFWQTHLKVLSLGIAKWPHLPQANRPSERLSFA